MSVNLCYWLFVRVWFNFAFFRLIGVVGTGGSAALLPRGGGVERGSCEFAQASLVVFAGRSSS